uniref:Uncharacterized protein n=1 Tax=Physcomitrium patens TaxID=3218 RepID=A0A2K1IX47_PHYPA|nr:hypothetical protein PHYPA_023661 [Physcomitrium patens]
MLCVWNGNGMFSCPRLLLETLSLLCIFPFGCLISSRLDSLVKCFKLFFSYLCCSRFF